MLTDTQIEQFQNNGFLNAGKVLAEAEVQELSDALDDVIEIGPDGFADRDAKPVLYRNLATDETKPVWQIVNIWQASDAFKRLIHHPFIVRAISQLTGFGDLQVWHDQVQYKPANHGGATTWHQDAPLWPSIEPMTPVSAWIPFDDADLENGCMWMAPGSHQWGDCREFLPTIQTLTHLPEFTQIDRGFEPPDGRKVEAVACPVKRGEVHFHHSLTWHGSPANQSTRPRRAVAIHYMTSEAVFTGRDHAMKPYIQVEVGEPMAGAGECFPAVARGGEPVVCV